MDENNNYQDDFEENNRSNYQEYTQNQQYQQTQYQQNYQPQYRPPKSPGYDYALYSLISAVVGFFTGLGLVGGILGLIFNKKAVELGENSDLQMAGKICSIIATAIGALIALIIIAQLVMFFIMMIGAMGMELAS
jgi:hypothetical protein